MPFMPLDDQAPEAVPEESITPTAPYQVDSSNLAVFGRLILMLGCVLERRGRRTIRIAPGFLVILRRCLAGASR